MNLHVPQVESARAEALEIMSVPHMIVSPQANKPMIGLVQDSIVGWFFLTRQNTFLTRTQVMDLCMQIQYAVDGKPPNFGSARIPPPAILKPTPLWTGKQLMSMLLPKSMNLKRKVRDLDDDDCMDRSERMVTVRDGTLVCGSLCSQTLGTASGGLIHIFFKDLGSWPACHFISDAQRVATTWLSWRNLSVGIEDCMATEEMKEKAKDVVDRAVDRIDMISRFARGIESNTSRDVPTRTGEDFGKLLVDKMELEAYSTKITNKVIDQAGRIIQKHTTVENNAIQAMISSKSKGNPFNSTQMRLIVGQQNNEGQRIHSESESRTLPSYKHRELIPNLEGNGFVASSYEKGLNPKEFFFHMMGGREGLVDTSVKTAETGYNQRRLIKTMEDHQIDRDGIIRNSNNQIIEFAYGGDGMDATYIEKISCKFLMLSDREIREQIDWESSNHPELPNIIQREYDRIVELRDRVRKMKDSLWNKKFEDTLFIPIDVKRMVCVACREQGYCPEGEIRPAELLFEVDKLCDDLIEVSTLRAQTKRTSRNKRARVERSLVVRSTDSIRMAIRCELISKNVVHNFACNWSTWRSLRQKIFDRYIHWSANPGEMVGALAAQSIGEPSTQMTLKSKNREKKKRERKHQFNNCFFLSKLLLFLFFFFFFYFFFFRSDIVFFFFSDSLSFCGNRCQECYSRCAQIKGDHGCDKENEATFCYCLPSRTILPFEEGSQSSQESGGIHRSLESSLRLRYGRGESVLRHRFGCRECPTDGQRVVNAVHVVYVR
jgi:DNA-directed RNA polymerase II subunit RPB1